MFEQNSISISAQQWQGKMPAFKQIHVNLLAYYETHLWQILFLLISLFILFSCQYLSFFLVKCESSCEVAYHSRFSSIGKGKDVSPTVIAQIGVLLKEGNLTIRQIYHVKNRIGAGKTTSHRQGQCGRRWRTSKDEDEKRILSRMVWQSPSPSISHLRHAW